MIITKELEKRKKLKIWQAANKQASSKKQTNISVCVCGGGVCLLFRSDEWTTDNKEGRRDASRSERNCSEKRKAFSVSFSIPGGDQSIWLSYQCRADAKHWFKMRYDGVRSEPPCVIVRSLASFNTLCEDGWRNRDKDFPLSRMLPSSQPITLLPSPPPPSLHTSLSTSS